MSRISKDEYGMLIAFAARQRSEDPSTRVGVALEDHSGRIIGCGYNGLKAGRDYQFDGNRDERLDAMIHAETNALSLVRRGEAKRIFITHSPCAACCLNIIAHGIEEVIFCIEYHGCKKFKKILPDNGVRISQIDLTRVKEIVTMMAA